MLQSCFCFMFVNYYISLEYTLGYVSPRVPLIEVLMITNQGYCLLMVNIELSDRLKLIKHQMKIFQA